MTPFDLAALRPKLLTILIALSLIVSHSSGMQALQLS
jgi:hypothetical protein